VQQPHTLSVIPAKEGIQRFHHHVSRRFCRHSGEGRNPVLLTRPYTGPRPPPGRRQSQSTGHGAKGKAPSLPPLPGLCRHNKLIAQRDGKGPPDGTMADLQDIPRGANDREAPDIQRRQGSLSATTSHTIRHSREGRNPALPSSCFPPILPSFWWRLGSTASTAMPTAGPTVIPAKAGIQGFHRHIYVGSTVTPAEAGVQSFNKASPRTSPQNLHNRIILCMKQLRLPTAQNQHIQSGNSPVEYLHFPALFVGHGCFSSVKSEKPTQR
jgi:hypothetical protein